MAVAVSGFAFPNSVGPAILERGACMTKLLMSFGAAQSSAVVSEARMGREQAVEDAGGAAPVMEGLRLAPALVSLSFGACRAGAAVAAARRSLLCAPPLSMLPATPFVCTQAVHISR